ncbi:MAG TPA: hypothetical protein VFR09_03045, partial [Alphaproteobacteria bacterium]|nr:hypothetical protein [Alphaproteobacteria bacterium]
MPAFFAASLATIFFTAFASPAFADATTAGQVICNLSNNMLPFIDVFNMVAYVAGCLFIVQGVLGLKNYYDNPSQNPLNKTFMMLIGGCLLSMLPSALGMLVDTLFFGGAVGEGADAGG